jgi:hypothetical protein
VRASKRAAGALTIGAVLAAPVVAPAAAQGQAPTAKPKLRAVARHHVRAGSSTPVKGSLVSGTAGGRRILVQARNGHGWKTVARTKTGRSGRFHAGWRASQVGSYSVRVLAPGSGATPRRVGGGKVTVYRPVTASWYGPGLYGNKMACGGRLSSGTVGVANKTLPCGTRVTLRYRGRSVTVPVVDRGPYAAGRTYDLTPGAKQRLHFGSTGVVWSSR